MAKIDEGTGLLTFESPVGDLFTSPRPGLVVADIMNREVVSVQSSDTTRFAVQTLHKNGVSCVMVVDEGTVVGIVTEGDILTTVARREKPFGVSRVASIMSCPVDTISPETPVLYAGTMMESKGIKRLPVIADGQLIGIVTHTDVIRALISQDPLSEISEIMSPDVVSCDVGATVAEAAQVMSSRRVTCLLVVHCGNAMGMLTEKDVLKRVAALGKDPTTTLVADVMSLPIQSVSPTYSVFSAGKKMDEMHIHRLVVMDGQNIRGIVTKTDVLRAIAKRLRHNLASRMHHLARSENPAYVLDSQGATVYVNPAFIKLFEADMCYDFIGEPFLPDRFLACPEKGHQTIDSLRSEDFALRRLTIRTAKRRELNMVLFSTFTRGINGEFQGTQGVLFDLMGTVPNDSVSALENKG